MVPPVVCAPSKKSKIPSGWGSCCWFSLSNPISLIREIPLFLPFVKKPLAIPSSSPVYKIFSLNFSDETWYADRLYTFFIINFHNGDLVFRLVLLSNLTRRQFGAETSLENSPTWYTVVSPMTVYWNATASTWSELNAEFRDMKPNLELNVYSEVASRRALSTFS